MSKNQKKKNNLSPAMLVLLVLTAISLGTTGVLQAVMKNRQLQVVREIEKVERRVSEMDRDIINLEIRIDQFENIFEMRAALAGAQTHLQEIPLEAIIDIPAVGTLPEMASNY